MSGDPGGAIVPDDPHEEARERVQFPAMFLTANGVLNLLVALFQVGLFVVIAAAPAESVQRVWVERLEPFEKHPDAPMAPLALDALNRARAADPEAFKRQRLVYDGLGTLWLLALSLAGVAGGVRMYQARSYPVAMVGALASLLPCVSPMACCCLGELIGIWCVVVLLSPAVRTAFR